MPAFTYLSDSEVREWRSVSDDKECNDLLQEFRKATGEDWLIGVRQWPVRRTFWKWLRRTPITLHKHHTLYADCHGEWQVINLVTPNGGSVFYGSAQSREDIMNFMLGYLAGIDHISRKRRSPTNAE